MKRLGWLSVGLVLTIAIAAAASAAPAVATSLKGTSPSAAITASSSEPAWGQGNGCVAPYGTLTVGVVNGHQSIYCDVTVQGHYNYFTNQITPVYVWWNFTANETQGMILTVQVDGSWDCLNFNFHSFYGTINILLFGTGYYCNPAGGVNAGSSGPSNNPGVNVAINSEGDAVTVIQTGSGYSSNFYVYGTTTSVSFLLGGSELSPTVYYMGITAGFGTCPSGITFGRVYVHGVSGGAYNTLSTIWVDGTNVAAPPANVPYFTIHWWPINGGLAKGDKLGYEVTQSAPSLGCGYL
jgi:hypothetical protein